SCCRGRPKSSAPPPTRRSEHSWNAISKPKKPPEDMDLHYKQEVTVGVLVLAGVGLFLAGTMWLKGTSFTTEPRLQVVFPDVGTLKQGSPVRVSGVSLGKVERIEFQDVGRVLVSLSISPKIQPKIDATAQLTTVGLVADAIVNFNPGTSST